MPAPIVTTHFDFALERHALRKYGLLGWGADAPVFGICYNQLPPDARVTIALIVKGGPFLYPDKDGKPFDNRIGDLPEGEYLEYTVRTPRIKGRGKRRIVARRMTGLLFFTACHYERVQATGATKDERKKAQREAMAATDEEYRNGFYLITGMPPALAEAVRKAVASIPYGLLPPGRGGKE